MIWLSHAISKHLSLGEPMQLRHVIAGVSFIAQLALNSAARANDPIGPFEIWQDFEGGKICDVILTDEVSIGGKGLQVDQTCLEAIDFGGEPLAWHIDDEGWLRFTDALRKFVLRFEPQADGSFYARRVEEQKESLVLSRAD
jgi:hypothetical protein